MQAGAERCEAAISSSRRQVRQRAAGSGGVRWVGWKVTYRCCRGLLSAFPQPDTDEYQAQEFQSPKQLAR
ncbi:hypothetical protein Pmani_025502 [Petrolisthes manimaculis]|uniref:Uncharacterized protein n=1 Tax=Petrolisthes manimaculis TaxID=1843537 RepID=A0AAE1U133_9EUCA|nr:hypothetical protein Pmani_025502 [Petrolisthes manimaculis]